jgi:hypothetical protein
MRPFGIPSTSRWRCRDDLGNVSDEDMHRHAAESIERADAPPLWSGDVPNDGGAAWRPVSRTGGKAGLDGRIDGTLLARTDRRGKKYVVSSTLDRVDWNAELVRGTWGRVVQQPGQSPVMDCSWWRKLPQALAELGLIDEYEFVVQPRLAGHGPTLFAGLSKCVDLKLVDRLEFPARGRWRCGTRRKGSHLAPLPVDITTVQGEPSRPVLNARESA